MEDILRDEFENQKEMSLGNRLMLLGHLLNGVALTLLSIGSILRDCDEVPARFRNSDSSSSRISSVWD